MKTIFTAEQFEEEVAKLQARCDRAVTIINDHLMKKTKELYEKMDADQQSRARMRFQAKQREMKNKIIMPGRPTIN
jgi:hypothetical protein